MVRINIYATDKENQQLALERLELERASQDIDEAINEELRYLRERMVQFEQENEKLNIKIDRMFKEFGERGVNNEDGLS